MVDPSVRRACDILKKVAHNGEVIEFDVLNVSAAMQVEPHVVSHALVQDGVHTVDYEAPQFSVYKLSAKEELVGVKRAAAFARFKK